MKGIILRNTQLFACFRKCFENILPFSETIFVLLQADFRFNESGCKRFVEQKMYQRMMDDILKQIKAGEVSGVQFKERILDKYYTGVGSGITRALDEDVNVTFMNNDNIAKYITSLVAAGYLQMTNPDNPTASNQKYKKVNKR